MNVDRPVIVFDGICNLCNTSVDFVIRHDPDGHFKFAAAQSPAGQALLDGVGLDEIAADSVVVVCGTSKLVRSDAVLEIAKRLGWPWKAAALLRFVPRRLRDRAYGLLAANRYRLFGTRTTCRVPTPVEADRFL